MHNEELLTRTTALALDYLNRLPARPVTRAVDFPSLLSQLGRTLPAEGTDTQQVIEHLVTAIEPGLVTIGAS